MHDVLQDEQIIQNLKSRYYAFIDLGCGDGESISYCEGFFGLAPGVGFDISERKIEMARQRGHHVVHANVIQTNFPEQCVSFVTMMDFLEHLYSLDDAKTILQRAGLLARDFIFIRHPSFEDIEYLKRFGLKLDWTDWTGHRNMMTLADFENAFEELGWTQFSIMPRKQIFDSDHPAIVPLDAPTDTVRYDSSVHGAKAIVHFGRPIWTQFDIIVRLPGSALPHQRWIEVREAVVLERRRKD
jgi:hypothetical protein